MKFWQSTSFTEADQLVDVAKICDEVGFEGVFVSDHLFFPEQMEAKYPYSEDGVLPGFDPHTPWPDAMAMIAAMSSVTERIKFSTLVYILPLRRPIEVAKMTSTLQMLTEGRFALGAGAGWMEEEFRIMGAPFKNRGKAFNESIEVLHKLWSGEMVEHHGEIYDFPRIAMSPAPPTPIPIYIGGTTKAALRRAATLGNGWLGAGHTVDEGIELLNQLNAFRKEAGRENEEFEAVVPLVSPPDPDDFRRLEDAGCTATVSYPFTYTIGPTSTIDQKRAYLEGFAEGVIKGMG